MSSNKWLKRIFSIEFAALVVAIIAAYFAYIPIKDYFFDDNSIVASIHEQEIELSTDKEKCDTIVVIAYTYNEKSIPISGLLTLKNISDHVIKGLNVRTEYITDNVLSFISCDWVYLVRNEQGSAAYCGSELPPYGKVSCAFQEISRTNYDDPAYHGALLNIKLAYEGCKKEKMISLLIILYNIDVNDIFYKRYGNGTPAENRAGFNTDFIDKCVAATYENFDVEDLKHPSRAFVYLNTFDCPLILSIDQIKDMRKELK